MQAIIIAGGKGTRLSKYTEEIPKPMINVNNKPVLEYQINKLKEYGINNIIITVGYLKDSIINYFGDGSYFGVNISYVEETEPLGTAGAFYFLKNKIKEECLIVFGDIIFDFDIHKFYEFHKKHSEQISLVAHPNSHPYDSNIVVCDSCSKVQKIEKKSIKRDFYYENLVNAGVYIFDKSVFSYFTEVKKMDLENNVLVHYIEQQQVCAYKTPEYIKDMGTYERLEEVERQLNSGVVTSRNLKNAQKCVFLDRDGTINKKNGLIYRVEDLELEDRAADGIKRLNENGYLCIVITNQSVIARNLCTMETLKEIHNKMETLLGEHGAYVDSIYFCPHHPDRGYPEENIEYKIECQCRKPGIALIEEAVREYSIDLTKSYFVGDTTVDIKTGKNVALRTILVQTGEAGKDNKYNVTPDKVCKDLYEAANYIINERNR